MDKLNYAYKKLKDNSYKNTMPRKVILEFMNNSEHKHMSCDEIHRDISKKYPDIGIATVYRNMQLFEELKIVTRLTLADGIARYEINDLSEERHQHHHLVCLNCGKLIEIGEDLLGPLEQKITRETGFQIEDHDLKFFGYCKECQNEKEHNEEQ